MNQQQRALAEQVDEAARQYISGPLKDLLAKKILAVEEAAGQAGYFSLVFGFDAFRNSDALDILVVGYKSVLDSGDGYVQAAVRIEGGARPDPEPTEPREIVPYIAAETYGAPGVIDLNDLDDHISRARLVVKRLLSHFHPVKPGASTPARAFAHMNAGRAPAPAARGRRWR